eukprot:397380_1
MYMLTAVLLSIIVRISLSFNLPSGIYGNAGMNYVGGNNALSVYDPKTGNVTTIARPPTDIHSITESDLAAFDIKNEIYLYYTEVINYATGAKVSIFGGYNLNSSYQNSICRCSCI